MPSRSIGDFRLKYSEFNNHKFSKEEGYRQPIPTFTGPYITHEPDIQVFNLSKKDKWLVLATDGMWDEISRKQSAKIADEIDFSKAAEGESGGKLLLEKLIDETLESCCKTHGVTRSFLDACPPGPRKRAIVDDISIIVLNLQN